MKILQETSLSYLISLIKSKLNLKFDKAGGEITGNVKIDKQLTLDIEDEDFDSGIYFNQALDNNYGTTLTLGGYAHGDEQTWYKVLLRNISDPKAASDAATKGYVDNKVAVDYLVGYIDDDGSVIVASNTYDKAYAAASGNKECYLKLNWSDAIYILKLKAWENYNGHSQGTDVFVFEDNSNANVNRTVRVTKTGAYYIPMIFEDTSNKSQDISTDKTSTTKYPSTKATYDFVEMELDRRAPVLIYEGTEGLKVDGTLVEGTYTEGAGLITVDQGEGASGQGKITSWNLLNVDFSPYKSLRVVYKRNSVGSGTTAEFNLPLDVPPIEGNGQKYYAAGAQSVSFGDRNRMNCIMVGVDEAKTSFAVLQTFSLYGTAVTPVNNIRVVRIEGIYKTSNPYPVAQHVEEVEF